MNCSPPIILETSSVPSLVFPQFMKDENPANSLLRSSANLHSWIHHAKPFIMPGKVFHLFTCDFPKPILHFRRIHVVVIRQVLRAGVIGRVNNNALHLPGIVRQQCLQGGQGYPPAPEDFLNQGHQPTTHYACATNETAPACGG